MMHNKWKNIRLESDPDVQQNGKSITELFRVETRNRIIKFVMASRSGISHGILANKVGIDRKNLRPYMKELQQENLIVRGKDGKYYIGEKALGTDHLANYLLANNIIENVLDQDDLLFNDIMQFNPTAPMLDFNDGDNPELRRTMLEFSNKIGALVTYIIIESLNLRNKQTNEMNLDRELHDFFISNRWIKNYFDQILPSLPFIFKEKMRDYLHLGGRTMDEHANAIIDYSYELPLLQLDNKLVRDLKRSFSKLYPNFFSKIEGIRMQLPNDIREEIDHSKYMEMRIATERKCKHKFERNPPRLVELDEGRKKWITWLGAKHCRRCHRTITSN